MRIARVFIDGDIWPFLRPDSRGLEFLQDPVLEVKFRQCFLFPHTLRRKLKSFARDSVNRHASGKMRFELRRRPARFVFLR